MGFKNLLDLHVHSDNSPDAHHKITLLCERSLERGIRAIAVTDHCECDQADGNGFRIVVRQSYFEAMKARSVFRGRLVVCPGVELGQPASNPDAAQSVLRIPFDFVLASVHRVEGFNDFYHLDYSLPENDPYMLLDRYFADVLNTVRWGGFDSLAHLTYPLRYMPAQVSLSRYADRIDGILRLLAQKDKALEINTQSIRKGVASTCPPAEIVSRFCELGGKYVTVGSDAHYADDVGADIGTAMSIAKDSGFDSVALYMSRTPTPIEIV